MFSLFKQIASNQYNLFKPPKIKGSPYNFIWLGMIFICLGLLLTPIYKAQASAYDDAVVVEYHTAQHPYHYAEFNDTKGRTLYCADGHLYAPATGKIYNYGWEWCTGPLAYCLYHGYPCTNVIEGHKLSDLEALHVTQTCIWMLRGYLSEDQIFLLDSEVGDGFAGDKNKEFDVYSDEGKKAINDLYKASKAYKPSPSSPEEKFSRLYYSNYINAQDMIVVPHHGKITLEKTTQDLGFETDIEFYKLDGIEFKIYRGDSFESAQDIKKSFILKSIKDNEGKTKVLGFDKANPSLSYISLVKGTYWLVEQEPVSEGIISNKEPIGVVVEEGKTTAAGKGGKVINEAIYYSFNPLIVKKAKGVEDNEEAILPLKDAQFKVDYYPSMKDELPEKPLYSWILKSDDKGLVVFDEDYLVDGDRLFKDEKGKSALPLGTLVIEEIKAPVGYEIAENPRQVLKLDKQGNDICLEHEPLIFEDSLARCDLIFSKVNGETKEGWPDIPFLLTNLDTDEAHVIVTRVKGSYCSNSEVIAHTKDTNANDFYITDKDREKDLKPCGLWFSKTKDSEQKPHDDLGAMPPGNYRIEELRCSKNENCELITRDFTLDGDDQFINLGTLENYPAAIKTQLLTSDGQSTLETDETNIQLNLADTVHYKNLEKGATYTFKGSLHWVEDGKDTGEVKDGDEKPIVKTIEVVCEDTKGDLQFDYQVDISLDSNETKQICAYVVVEKDNKVFYDHSDPTSKSQTITIKNNYTPPPIPPKPPSPPPQTFDLPTTGFPTGVIGLYLVGILCIGKGVIRIRQSKETRMIW